jgi:NAD(P)-dependent dehydrogenase (short-subunit alcohol dehydrogenase family)
MTPHKVAIITGASRGIGAGLVTGYRKRGWAVVASARTIRPSRDPDLLALAADTTDPIAASGIVDAALERFGRLDTLVNNSGVVIAKPFTDYTATDFVTVVGTSLSGFFWLTQRAIGEMALRYGGHVVTVSATPPHAADPGAPALLAALAAGGLAAATRSLAVEYAARGIRVNAVSTRAIKAPLYPADGYHDLGSWLPPLGRTGQASDIVDGVLFLEFSPYITGEILHIDGGQSALGEQV